MVEDSTYPLYTRPRTCKLTATRMGTSVYFINPDLFSSHGQDILLSAKQLTFAFSALKKLKVYLRYVFCNINKNVALNSSRKIKNIQTRVFCKKLAWVKMF